jgi:putative thioredoxin
LVVDRVAGVEATLETFEQDVVERSRERPVVVDFWAEWCGPCHALAPVLERAVEARGGSVELVKVDVDANQELAGRYAVRGIPAVKAFRNGNVVDEFVGAQSPASVDAFLDRLTAPSEAERLVAALEERGELPDVVEAYRSGDHERVLSVLLELIRAGSAEQRDELRRLMVAVFGELGQEHPVAVAYRRQLATALY